MSIMNETDKEHDDSLDDASISSSTSFKQLQFNYLIGNILAAVANHLPGAYRYAIYESYGISRSTIELFYVCYYGSSLLIGTFIAALADKFGRRLACIFFCLFYALYCISFHFHLLWILILGTIPWGIASSLDQTAIEAWLVTEHRRLSLNTQSLKRILGNTFIVKILLSVGVAFLSQFLVQSFGYLAPFNLAIVAVIIMIIFMLFKWPENYGNKNISSTTSFFSAIKTLRHDFRIVLLGLSTSFFEAAVYLQGIQWTPTLESAKRMIIYTPLPLGFCFGGQILCRFIGTLAFAPLSKQFRTQSFMIIIFLLAMIGLSVPIFLPNAQWPILVGFFLYEFCVGVYRPSSGLLRSQYIHNEIRTTLMSYLRVPQLLLVIGILLCHFPLSIVFIIWTSLILLAMLCMIALRCLKIPDEETLIQNKETILFDSSSIQINFDVCSIQYSPETPLITHTLLGWTNQEFINPI